MIQRPKSASTVCVCVCVLLYNPCKKKTPCYHGRISKVAHDATMTKDRLFFQSGVFFFSDSPRRDPCECGVDVERGRGELGRPVGVVGHVGVRPPQSTSGPHLAAGAWHTGGGCARAGYTPRPTRRPAPAPGRWDAGATLPPQRAVCRPRGTRPWTRSWPSWARRYQFHTTGHTTPVLKRLCPTAALYKPRPPGAATQTRVAPRLVHSRRAVRPSVGEFHIVYMGL